MKLCVPEIDRRQNHIGSIDLNHPLKQVALDCLKDRDVERPSAQQLCERIAAMKEDPQYSESARVIEANLRSIAEQDRNDERDRELRSRHSQQIQGLQQIIQSQTSHLAEKDQTITRREQTITQNSQILREKDETIAQNKETIAQQAQQLGDKERELAEKVEEIDRLERQLGRVNQQLEESERVNAQFQRQIIELEQLRPATDTLSSSIERGTSIKLTWREGEKALRRMSGSYRAAMDGSTLYVAVAPRVFYYNVSSSSWSQLPDSPTLLCPSVVIYRLLTVVGGRICGAHTITNQLFSLTGESSGRRWTEEFPPMPTKRYGTIVLCTKTALIIAGGWNDESKLRTVEVMDVVTF